MSSCTNINEDMMTLIALQKYLAPESFPPSNPELYTSQCNCRRLDYSTDTLTPPRSCISDA